MTRFTGEVTPPGDKSISQRTLLLSSVAGGTSRISHLNPSRDCLATMGVMDQLGVRFRFLSDTEILIDGLGGDALPTAVPRGKTPGIQGGFREPATPLNCLNSGTSARLLAGLLSGFPFLSILTGDSSLRGRPMKRVVEPLRGMGATILGRGDGAFLPVAIQGRFPLQPIDYALPLPSAQVKSAILLAGLFAAGTTVVREALPTRDHTERMLRVMGVDCVTEAGSVRVKGPSTPLGISRRIPGDPSGAAFFAVGAAIHPGSRLVIRDVSLNPTRTVFFEILRKMGALVTIVEEKSEFGEPVGTVVVEGRSLSGISIQPEMVPGLIDEIPVLMVAMAAAGGNSSVTGAEELRRKESDRLHVMVEELKKFRADVQEYPDGFEMTGGNPLFAPPFSNPQGDHRVAMSLAILGTIAHGTTHILNMECAGISYPSFEQDFRQIHT